MKTKRKSITIFFSHIFSFLIFLLTILILYGSIEISNKAAFYLILSAASIFSYIFTYLFFTRKYRRRKKLLKLEFPPQWEHILNTTVFYYTTLSSDEKKRFKEQILLFIHEKKITAIETEIDDTIKILVAASAIIPVFNYPDWEYDRLDEVLVYPRGFDENYNFDKLDVPILGMVLSNTSSMIISKPALIKSFKRYNDSFNVGIHEFIHKVDGEDGEIDGIPALLMDRATADEYLIIVDQVMKDIQAGRSELNPYALTNRAEFFAVASESFFENPEKMERMHPNLYIILKKVFRQDTKTLFSSAISSMFGKKKKIGRNAKCPCGSGKKYKHCCMNKKLTAV